MSTALRCYHSLITTILGERKLDVVNTKIHSFIEVGGYGERFIKLVNYGLSRETSLEIDAILPKSIDITSIDTLNTLYQDDGLNKLHVITQREINNLLNKV